MEPLSEKDYCRLIKLDENVKNVIKSSVYISKQLKKEVRDVAYKVKEIAKETLIEKIKLGFNALKVTLGGVSSFLASKDLVSKVGEVGEKIAEFASKLFKLNRPSISAGKTHVSGSDTLYTAHFLAGIGAVCGAIASTVCLVQAGKMIKKGIRLVDKEIRRPKQEKQSHWEYGRSLIRKGIREIIVHSTSVAASLTGIMQAAAKITSLIQPASTAITTTVLQVGTIITAPITLCLSAYGAKVNIQHIRDTSAQLQLLRDERDRLNALKQKMRIANFTDQTTFLDGREVNLREREEIVRFALRRAGDRRITNIASLVANSLYMASSVLSVGSLATGPGAAVLGTIALVCVAVGVGGTLLTRGILAALRHHRKTKEKQRMRQDDSAPRYISSKQMLAKAKNILSTDQKNQIFYQEKERLANMSNGELLTFLLKGSSTRLSSQQMRGAFLVGDEHYWSKAFS